MAVKLSLDDELALIRSSGKTPKLLLHCCCAPCASYVVEYLAPYFVITVLYYNPNIQPRREYDRRAAEFRKLPVFTGHPNRVDMVKGGYDADVFQAAAAPFRDEPEGGRRCRVCFELRLAETARRAKEGGYDFFATTLSVSPHKDAAVLNEVGRDLEGDSGVRFLCSDFKKHDGYKHSVELSKMYGLYRQSYCGCLLSASIRSER